MRVALLLLALALVPAAAEAARSHAVRAHVTRSGAYVSATRATNPNHTRLDNYSTRGNVNPASGRVGAKRP